MNNLAIMITTITMMTTTRNKLQYCPHIQCRQFRPEYAIPRAQIVFFFVKMTPLHSNLSWKFCLRNPKWTLYCLYAWHNCLLSKNTSRVKKVFKRLWNDNIKIHAKKCEVLRKEMSYHEHIIAKDSVKPKSSKIEHI